MAHGGGLIGILLTILHIYCVIWAYSDAERRGKPGLLVALIVLVAPFFGIILWLLIRPEGRYRRR
jgi:hypothetical protein